jgi:hypothetical protein
MIKGGAKGVWGAQPPLTTIAENYAKTTTNFLCRFATTMLNFLGHVINHWKGVFKTILTVYYKPPNS